MPPAGVAELGEAPVLARHDEPGLRYGLVWVSPSTTKRVLGAQGLHLKQPRRIGTSAKRPFPAWATYEKNSIWIYDPARFARCRTASAVAIMDLVTRKWLTTVVSGEETSTQIQVAFIEALEDENPLEVVEAPADGVSDLTVDDPPGRSCSRSRPTGRR